MSNIGTKFILAQRFVFDPNSNSLVDQTNEGEIVRLGSNESRILLMLSERPNEVITRNELHEYVWRDQGFEVDDSSLTQAISTLRKMLKDSTKSPEFVKTVPKRGYQFIATVERSAPFSSSDQTASIEKQEVAVEATSSAQMPAEETVETAAVEAVVPPTPAAKPEVPSQSTATKAASPAENKWLYRALGFLAILMPILVVTFTNPAESEFRTLAEVDGVQILSPINHPDLSGWIPAIEKCVTHYNAEHGGQLKPIQIIATGGQTNNLALNYIHAQEYSSENITLRLYANQTDLSEICKGDQ
ncbi:transcriptional regulator [Vibrio sp. Isolate30]|uniref:transcriptional regulator n=1 Tax=Vibrio sp. Isolate30 TaxID=2908536 RepID=UPI001EFD833F|nr:transcriptional regulator [Vibrio sp. Isolate30]MCG9631570.1 winged helix-turn-helix domain-containing protein [Vibrio sp. Isolate30]